MYRIQCCYYNWTKKFKSGGCSSKKSLEILDYLKPTKWWLENPRNGLLKSRPYMAGIPYVDVDYCQYAGWGYKKPTRIWGSRDISDVMGRLCDWLSCLIYYLENQMRSVISTPF